MKNSYLILSYLILSILAIPELSSQEFAQGDLFRNSSLSEKEMDRDQLKVLNSVTGSYKSDYQVVSIDIDMLDKGEGVKTSFYASGKEMKLKHNRVESKDEWHKVYIDPEDGSRMAFTSLDGVVMGTIHSHKEGSYTLYPISYDDFVMIKTTRDKKSCGNGVEVTKPRIQRDRGEISNRALEFIKVVTLVTQDVDKNWGYTTWFTGGQPYYTFIANVAFNQVLDIDANSQVPGVVYSHEVNKDVLSGYCEDGATTDDILMDMLANQHLIQYRNAYKADLVMVLIDNPNNSDAWGQAGSLTLEVNKAIAVAQVDRALTDFVYAHEIFHLFGCQHQLDEAQDQNLPYHYAFLQGWSFPSYGALTVMWSLQNAGSETPIPYLSNPDVDFDPGILYDEKPIGRSDRDNARVVEENASIIENFRSGSKTMRAYINKGDNSYNHPAGSFNLPVTKEGTSQSITSVQYAFSQNGSSYSSSSFPFSGFSWSFNPSTYSIACYASSSLVGSDVYVRATVNTSSQSFTAYYKFQVVSGSGFTSDEPIITRSEKEISLFPNPAGDELNIRGVSFPQKIEIYNTSGKLVMRTSAMSKIDLSNLPVSQYIVSFPELKQSYVIIKE